jgi:hypothetical protein
MVVEFNFDFITVFTFVFMSTILGFVIAFTIYAYRDLKSDEEYLNRGSKAKSKKHRYK